MRASLPPIPAAEAQRQRAQRQRLRRRVLTLAFAFPLLFLAWALFLALGPKPPPPPVVPRPTPRQAATAESHLEAVAQELRDSPPAPVSPSRPAAAPRGSTPGDSTSEANPPPVQHRRGPQGQDLVTLQISEADVNTYLASNPQAKRALQTHGVQAVQVVLLPPADVLVRAAVTVKGSSSNVEVKGTLTPDPSTGLRFEATGARVGLLPAPAAFLTAQANKLGAQFAGSLHGRLPLHVQSVSVEKGRLVLRGVAAGRAASGPAPSPPAPAR